MKITIPQHKLAAALAAAKPISGGQLPVTSSVLLTAGRELSVQVDNLQHSLVQHLDAEVAAPGAVGLPARKLAAIVASLPDVPVTIEVDATHNPRIIADNVRHIATITAGWTRVTLHGISPADFPAVLRTDGDAVYHADFGDLKMALNRVAPAISDDPARHSINGACMEFANNEMRLTSSDGRRLAQDLIGAVRQSGVDPEDRSKILGREAVGHLRKLAGHSVGIAISDGMASFKTPAWEFTSRLIEGRYPNWSQVIPTEFAGIRQVDRKAFLAALDRVSLIGSDSVRLAFEPGKVTLSATKPDVGDASESVDATGDAVAVVAFNPDYLRVPFESLATETVAIQLGRDGGASMVQDGAYRHILMPMRTT